jgi:hypothetical protein
MRFGGYLSAPAHPDIASLVYPLFAVGGKRVEVPTTNSLLYRLQKRGQVQRSADRVSRRGQATTFPPHPSPFFVSRAYKTNETAETRFRPNLLKINILQKMSETK